MTHVRDAVGKQQDHVVAKSHFAMALHAAGTGQARRRQINGFDAGGKHFPCINTLWR